MKPAHEYPVTLAYGAKPYPIYDSHHGVDHGAAYGAPVVLNNVTIGKVGNTGYVFPAPTPQNPRNGTHLHVDKKHIGAGIQRSDYVNPGEWWKIAGTVAATGYDNSRGNYIVVHYGGYEYRFLHLSMINVTKGQVIEDMSEINLELAFQQADVQWGRSKRTAELEALLKRDIVGRETNEAINFMYQHEWGVKHRTNVGKWKEAYNATYEQINEPVYRRKA